MANVPPNTVTPAGRSFEPRNNVPSIAFGGHVMNNGNNNAVVNARNGGNTQFAVRGNERGFRPPTSISRGWDRGHMHTFNHHRFRFFGGDWVLFDNDPYFYGGYGPDYGYGYGPDYADTYDEEPYTATTPTAPGAAYEYSSSAALAASVQQLLTRRGYSPGAVDGVIGGQTRNAIMDYQEDHHLPVTGNMDSGFLHSLGINY